MTKKELKSFAGYCKHVVKGYCTALNHPRKNEFRVIGYNRGVYGWNWTAFYDPKEDTLYIDGYRNFPAIKER